MSPMFGYVWSFLTPEFQEAHPSTKVDLLTASTTQHPKAKRKLPARVRTPCITSSEPLPKTIRKPFRGHGRICWPRPPWPPQRSAARPRRRGLSQPRHAAPWCLGRRGCDADGGAAAAAVEKQSDSHGMFLRVVGQNVDRS